MSKNKSLGHAARDILATARKSIQAVPRPGTTDRTDIKNVPRPEDERDGEEATRQQQIQKKIIDEGSSADRYSKKKVTCPDCEGKKRDNCNRCDGKGWVWGQEGKGSIDKQNTGWKSRAAWIKEQDDQPEVEEPDEKDCECKHDKKKDKKGKTKVDINPEIDNNIFASHEEEGELVEQKEKSKDREVGTKSLAKTYADDTPGQRLDELGDKVLDRYRYKAVRDVGTQTINALRNDDKKALKKAQNRQRGIKQARLRMQYRKEETELNELNKKLKGYLKSAEKFGIPYHGVHGFAGVGDVAHAVDKAHSNKMKAKHGEGSLKPHVQKRAKQMSNRLHGVLAANKRLRDKKWDHKVIKHGKTWNKDEKTGKRVYKNVRMTTYKHNDTYQDTSKPSGIKKLYNKAKKYFHGEETELNELSRETLKSARRKASTKSTKTLKAAETIRKKHYRGWERKPAAMSTVDAYRADSLYKQHHKYAKIAGAADKRLKGKFHPKVAKYHAEETELNEVDLVKLQYQNKSGQWITAREVTNNTNQLYIQMRNLQQAMEHQRVRAIGPRGELLDLWGPDMETDIPYKSGYTPVKVVEGDLQELSKALLNRFIEKNGKTKKGKLQANDRVKGRYFAKPPKDDPLSQYSGVRNVKKYHPEETQLHEISKEKLNKWFNGAYVAARYGRNDGPPEYKKHDKYLNLAGAKLDQIKKTGSSIINKKGKKKDD